MPDITFGTGLTSNEPVTPEDETQKPGDDVTHITGNDITEPND